MLVIAIVWKTNCFGLCSDGCCSSSKNDDDDDDDEDEDEGSSAVATAAINASAKVAIAGVRTVRRIEVQRGAKGSTRSAHRCARKRMALAIDGVRKL